MSATLPIDHPSVEAYLRQRLEDRGSVLIDDGGPRKVSRKLYLAKNWQVTIGHQALELTEATVEQDDDESEPRITGFRVHGQPPPNE